MVLVFVKSKQICTFGTRTYYIAGIGLFYNQEKAPKRVVVTTKMAYNEKPQRV